MIEPLNIKGYTPQQAAAVWAISVAEVYRRLRVGRRGEPGIPPEKVVYAGRNAYIDAAYVQAEAARRQALRASGIKKHGRR